jgi:DNA primase
MAKTYLDVVKYLIEARFSINGVVDKPDIIGAVFGQTEGLLGDELDLRELQKNGKIGRIEIEISPSNTRSTGKLLLPASLDKVETCILAAAIEAVDRVGPYECQFTVDKVEDTRTEKRRKILERAKQLVKNLMSGGMPDSRELAELVQAEVRVTDITSYGPENLPAGPEVGKSEELIIVEGRADVLNLLRFGIGNSIAVGGATNNIPQSIIKLSKEKEVTIFADGDRGGDMIIRSILNVADVDFVAKAPEGREVEELTRKEVIKAMRTKIPLDQYLQLNRMKPKTQIDNFRQHPANGRDDYEHRREAPVQHSMQHRQEPQATPADQLQLSKETGIKDISTEDIKRSTDPSVPVIEYKQEPAAPVEKAIHEREMEQQPAGRVEARAKPALESWVLSKLASGLDELVDTLRSRLYDQEGNVVKEVPIRELLPAIQESQNAYGIVLDGIITQRLVELAQQKGIRAIYGLRANPLSRKYPEMIMYTKENGKID